MVINIQPIERDGAFWIEIVMDGQPMERRGPFSADEAGYKANRLAAVCHAMHAEVVVAMPRPAAARKR
jgi:hypothetical protein